MATLPTYFKDFVSNIALGRSTRDELISAHTTLRQRLSQAEDLKDIFVGTFLQGSYRRSTGIRPTQGKRADVDVVLVTSLDSGKTTTKQAFDRFVPFLDKHYKGKWERQGRSFGVSMSLIDFDLVITATPEESARLVVTSESVQADRDLEDAGTWQPSALWATAADDEVLKEASAKQWNTKPLRIPDREAKEWDDTHPLEQIRWTHAKNKSTSGHYLGVVRAIKWWHRLKNDELEHPKSYPLEHIIGDCCPDQIKSMAEGVTRTLETMATRYDAEISLGKTPTAWDRGVQHDVLKRIKPGQFKEFIVKVRAAAKEARRAFDKTPPQESCKLWREFFGTEFPECGDDGNGNVDPPTDPKGGFTEPAGPANPTKTRFA